MKNAKKLDQYFTKPKVAKELTNRLLDSFDLINFTKEKFIFIEPSAGDGAFVDAVKDNKLKIKAFDIDPKNKETIKQDYLELNFEDLKIKNRNIITIGNPPFGNRGSLALEFINKSMKNSDVVAFILPIQFNKWGLQKNIDKNFALIKNIPIEEDSFLFLNEDYKVRSTFQIWVKNDLLDDVEDLRLKKAPPTKHKDFEMYQYNNTKTARKYFDYEWDFAVHRQGYKDYSKIFYDKKDLVYSTQYVFFKAKNEDVLNKLLKIDFEELSKLNTITPGFGKADIVAEYKRLYG